jgi:hypothetical protein
MSKWIPWVTALALVATPSVAFGQAPPPDEDEPSEAAADEHKKDESGLNSAILLDDSGRNVGVAKKNHAAVRKNWTLGAVFEAQRLINQEDLMGQGRNKFMNFLYLFGGYGITQFDRVQFRTGIYSRYLADSGETGLRMDDFEPMYQRIVPLPQKVTLRANASVILPLSYESQKLQGLLFAPRLLAQLDRRFGTFNLTWRGSSTYWINRYTTRAGGDANPYLSLSTSLNGEFAMPFHESWSIGTYLVAGAIFLHDPTNPNDPNVQRTGAVNDRFYGESQPVVNTYGFELFTRYIFPELNGVKSDFTFGYSNGDYPLGFMRMNRDGVNRLYGFFRTNAAFYAELGVRY